ncbi:MAG: hypothetical protein KatS3mg027_1359 [Bacteroidia bacterium]|nr:MAG: hypothetical protein KatS3mg027_1359 [Bacteroidia bacterium]
MRKITWCLFLNVAMGCFFNYRAQNIGINATGALPNNSAGLDVDFTNKGILIPRVALTARNSNAPIGAGIANSLLVYNTATSGTFPNNVTPGYYYWDGTQWQRLANGIANDWAINGNTLTGTLPGSPNEFIGTVNNADWIIKTNNTERMRVMGNGQVVINSTTPFAGDVFSTYAAGTNAAINGYATGSGEAVYGQNTGTGFAVVGITTNTNPGVYGQSTATGVYGTATSNNGTGVFGVGPSSVTVDGVNGIAGHNQAQGVVAFNSNATGTGLLAGGNNVTNMWYQTSGSAIAATSTSFGIVSYGIDVANGNGLAASGNSLTIINYSGGSGGTFHGQTIAVFGHANSSANNTWGGYFDNGSGTSFAYVGGRDGGGTLRKIVGNGTASSIIKDLNGKGVIMSCPEAPEILFEDFGVGKLVNGRAHIDIDPILAKNIVVDEKHPLRVFIQLEGECNGVYVTNKSKTGFDVIELNNGKSNVSFSWHIVANRADEYDENGNLISRNADARFNPAPEKKVPIYLEPKAKTIKVPEIPAIQPKNRNLSK